MSAARDEIRAALAHVPSKDRDTWLRMAKAVKSELGEDGFDLLNEWSQQDSTYQEDEGRTAWGSINASGRVTLSVLFQEAQKNGWKGPIHAAMRATDQAIARIDIARARRLGTSPEPESWQASIAAEQNVLGSILTDPSQWARVGGVLIESEFSRPDHRLIWRALASLSSSTGTALDVITVAEHLRLGNELDAAGGLPYLGTLARDTAFPDNSVTYAEIVKSHAAQRALASLGERLMTDQSTPADKIGLAQAILRNIETAWPAPRPLQNALPAVKAFIPELLPDALRDWVTDTAARTQAPIEYVAVSAMVCVGAALGRKIAVRPKRRDDWQEFGNLWGAVIGPPSWMKSPALDEGKRPLSIIEARLLEGYELERREWEIDAEAAKAKRDGARDRIRAAARKNQSFDKAELAGEQLPDEPAPARLIVNDATVPALCDVLRANPNGVLVFRDELAGLIAELDREGMEGSRGFYLTGWSGKDGHTQDRIARGTNLRVPYVCLSLLGGIQPSRVAPILRESIATGGGDGFLARFSLAVWPDSPGEYKAIDRPPDLEARQRAYAVCDALHALTPASIGAEVYEGVTPFLRLDAEAAEAFSDWDVDLRNRMRSGNEEGALAAHLLKYPKAISGLSMLIHLADGGTGEIPADAMYRALGWAELLESHARRIYSSLGQAHIDAARSLLNRLKRGDLQAPFTLRSVYVRGWANLSDVEAVRTAADLLEANHYLRSEAVSTGGRPSTVYTVNPGWRP